MGKGVSLLWRVRRQVPVFRATGLRALPGSAARAASIMPLRYMHTPSEVVSLADIQATIDLVCEYCRRLRPDTDFTPM
ncbi:hypothetical protein [Paracoccus mutanolyticus]|uniref:hypothetical protein n=1 Tax=Paracoccus mutanolyticus TaxID=1499308 RepID=UPI0016798E7E|nr:hypothetical protein [Paracoccus mutanolyticus]